MSLDDLTYIKQLDSANMVGSIELLDKQIQQTWQEISGIDVPSSYKDVNKIVFAGMGGSALGAHVFKHLYAPTLSIPFEIVSDYNLPAYVDENTLVFTGSYSGTTEEVLSCFDQAINKTKNVIAIAAGGMLEERAHINKVPFFKIDPKFNPCNQPRMGIGYSVFAILAFMNKLGFITISDSELSGVYDILKENNEKYGLSVNAEQNKAKHLAYLFHENVPILVAGEFLVGAIHAARNQINENAKSLAMYFPIPELNHHLMEALTFPTTNNDYYVLFNSSLYSPKITTRLELTKGILEKSGHGILEVEASGASKLAQVLQTINFGSYVGFYLSMLYGIDPSPIPNVEGFKEKLT